jgi:hypothetical protein
MNLMKKTFKVITLVAVLQFTSYHALAQPAPGVQSGNGPVLGGPIGGGAPIGSGVIVLLALGIVYSASKLYKIFTTDSYKGI